MPIVRSNTRRIPKNAIIGFYVGPAAVLVIAVALLSRSASKTMAALVVAVVWAALWTFVSLSNQRDER